MQTPNPIKHITNMLLITTNDIYFIFIIYQHYTYTTLLIITEKQ